MPRKREIQIPRCSKILFIFSIHNSEHVNSSDLKLQIHELREKRKPLSVKNRLTGLWTLQNVHRYTDQDYDCTFIKPCKLLAAHASNFDKKAYLARSNKDTAPQITVCTKLTTSLTTLFCTILFKHVFNIDQYRVFVLCKTKTGQELFGAHSFGPQIFPLKIILLNRTYYVQNLFQKRSNMRVRIAQMSK